MRSAAAIVSKARIVEGDYDEFCPVDNKVGASDYERDEYNSRLDVDSENIDERDEDNPCLDVDSENNDERDGYGPCLEVDSEDDFSVLLSDEYSVGNLDCEKGWEASLFDVVETLAEKCQGKLSGQDPVESVVSLEKRGMVRTNQCELESVVRYTRDTHSTRLRRRISTCKILQLSLSTIIFIVFCYVAAYFFFKSHDGGAI